MTKNNIKSSVTLNVSPYLLILFFFSGFAGLCYQIIWIRELSVVFGKTNAAITVVVSVFMLGLGLGSLFWGKKKITAQRFSRIFAYLQFGIAAGSLILLLIFPYLPFVYRGLVHHLHLSYTWILIFIFSLCAVLMFIPTFLMGGTFPIISRLYIRKQADVGQGIGLLYGMNTFGGILGAGLTGYFFIGLLGQRETQLIAIGINLLIGICFLKKRDIEPAAGKHIKQEPVRQSSGSFLSVQKFLVLTAFFTGFAGLAYEILWTRALSTFTSNSIYSFSSILVIYLAGIGLGSYIFAKFLSRHTPSMPMLVVLQFIVFFTVAFTAVFLNDIPDLLQPFGALMRFPILRIVFPGLFLSTVIMFLPAVIMGIVFPLTCKMYTDSLEHLRARVGKIYFYNTLGSMVGPVAAGFVLIPLAGVIKGLILTALVNFLLAAGGFYFIKKSSVKKKWGLAAVFLFAGVIVLPYALAQSSHVLPPSVFRNPHIPQELKYYKETINGTVVVVEEKNTGVRSCYVNNNAVCGVTYDALKVVHYMGHLPMIFKPKAQDVLVIGFGIGITTSAIAQHPVSAIDCVEICPGVREAAPLFARYNRGVWQDPRLNFIADDGRSYLLVTRKKYDVISCDPVHPSLGSGSLYTREYFALCKSLLKPGGVISQYLPLHKLTLDDLKTMLNTFYSVFPYAEVWLAQTHGVLIGSNQKLALSFTAAGEMKKRVYDPFFTDTYLLLSSLLMDETGIKSFVGGHAALHSDNHPILEYFSPRSVRSLHHYTNILELLNRRQTGGRLITDVPDPELLNLYIKALPYYIRGILYKNDGRREGALRLFGQALTINPQNREIHMFYDYLRQSR